MKSEYDVLIVGAGPAGSAAAIKCAQNNLRTLLIDKATLGRHKPCAGILPSVASFVLDELGLSLPPDVLIEPTELGIFYVPPSGRANGGELKNYRVFNLDRDLFDKCLVEKAVDTGVHLKTETALVALKQEECVEAALRIGHEVRKVRARYAIAADGAYSKVRRFLQGQRRQPVLTVTQEYWVGEGAFEDYFYMILNGKITSTYGYILKKKGGLLIGTGSLEPSTSIKSLNTLKNWLGKEFNLSLKLLKKREVGFIPYGECYLSQGSVLFVGDAAGLCNRFSGEGIRFALESGVAAADSIGNAMRSGVEASDYYQHQIQPLVNFIEQTSHLLEKKDDLWREEFVSTELKRYSLW